MLSGADAGWCAPAVCRLHHAVAVLGSAQIRCPICFSDMLNTSGVWIGRFANYISCTVAVRASQEEDLAAAVLLV